MAYAPKSSIITRKSCNQFQVGGDEKRSGDNGCPKNPADISVQCPNPSAAKTTP